MAFSIAMEEESPSPRTWKKGRGEVRLLGECPYLQRVTYLLHWADLW